MPLSSLVINTTYHKIIYVNQIPNHRLLNKYIDKDFNVVLELNEYDLVTQIQKNILSINFTCSVSKSRCFSEDDYQIFALENTYYKIPNNASAIYNNSAILGRCTDNKCFISAFTKDDNLY